MLIGYCRPYKDDLNCENQRKKLNEMHCQTIISEEHSSAKKRSKLNIMLSNLSKEDIVVVTKLFVFADTTRHLLELLEIIDNKGAYLKSLYEGIDTSNTSGYKFYDILHHLVEFQSDVISEKTRKGLSEAKEKGIASGRPRKPDENVQRAIIMYQSRKYSLTQIRNETGISKSTLYRYLEH